ncbi:phospho-N-acetylmuramoyl-pentapeptide-transferase [Catellatospora sichuanensis]|uniref:phospho-N-acetylmuramoyl-pentapeptide- transferase n=1 Tax=Catellatospora sichuanensis TaxID=1969805 RepID=UPI001182D328|nr:phospho-N-acetylmuramoyl-pentapeptide-transferase [Catellatospora sichuanensis]
MRAVIVAAAVAFVLSLLGTPLLAKALHRLKAGQPIRDELALKSNEGKRGTPGMGGLAFILATVVAYMAGHFALLGLPEAQMGQVSPTVTGLVLLGVFVFCGAIGFIDDYMKVAGKSSAGLSAKGKLLGQLLVGTIFGIIAMYYPSSNGETVGSTKISFVKDISWLDITKIGAVVLFVLMVMFMSNAVNLADGMDGLATGASVLVAGAYAIIGYWQYQHWCADTTGYAANPDAYCYSVRDPLEVAMIAAAISAACLGFLWSNTSPAKIFMGDAGALGLGGLMAAFAMATRTSILLLIIAFLFAMSLMSVVIQVISFRTTGKRVFRMSPIHYHFELGGWTEVNIVVRFWIVAASGVAIGLGLFYGDFLQNMP